LIYLIRHTTPLVANGVCYGQTDLDVTETFLAEAEIIKNVIPKDIEIIYTSPLQRCSKLAQEVFSAHKISSDSNLMELHCGSWEMQHWDAIAKEEIDPWMVDFVNVQIPNGESYTMLYDRVAKAFEKITKENEAKKIAIVAHGGVLRSILSYITNTPLKDSFAAFKIHYGAVVEIIVKENQFKYTFLSNIETLKEQHQPSNY
jgi:alpha-ribazole phosphatase